MCCSIPGTSHKVKFELIHVAPAPLLARLERPDDRVISLVKVFPRMLILGRIATTHVSAFQTETQVDPRIAQLQALLAALRRAWPNAPNMIQMHTRNHKAPLFTDPPDIIRVILHRSARE
jgi:hypothetical protein